MSVCTLITPQSASAPYQCCPLLSRLEYIDRRTCPDMSWAGPFCPQNCPFTRGDLDPIQYMVPWAYPSPHPKRHLDRFSRFCTAHGRESLYFTMGRPLSLFKIALCMGWRGGVTVRHLGLRSVGRRFKSCSRQRCVTTVGKLFTPMCLCHQAV